MNVVVADDKINPVYVQIRTKKVHFVRYNTNSLQTFRYLTTAHNNPCGECNHVCWFEPAHSQQLYLVLRAQPDSCLCDAAMQSMHSLILLHHSVYIFSSLAPEMGSNA